MKIKLDINQRHSIEVITIEDIRKASPPAFEGAPQSVIIDESIEGSEHPKSCIILFIDDFLEIFYYFNTHDRLVNDLTVFSPHDSKLLFIGGKRQTQTVDIKTGLIENVFKHRFSFRGFDLVGNGRFILDYGELNCALRDLNGEIRSSADLEMPWTYKEMEHGILLSFDEFSLTGSTFLPYTDF